MYFNGQLLWWKSAASERRKLLYMVYNVVQKMPQTVHMAEIIDVL